MDPLFGSVLLGLAVGMLVHQCGMRKDNAAGSRGLTLALAVISINVMSALDAASTLFLISNNYSKELNPVMNLLLDHSYATFFVVKLGLTLVATVVCWHYYERKKRARSIMRLASLGYCFLLAYHTVLLSSVIF